jgi:hypothetical protein
MLNVKRVWSIGRVPALLLVLVTIYAISNATGFDASTTRATHVPANFNESAGPQDLVMMPSQVLDPNPDAVRMHFWDPPLEMDRIEIKGIEYNTLKLPGEGSTNEPGEPDLPQVTRMIMVGKTGNVAIRTLNESYTVTSGIKVSPRQILQGDEGCPLDGVVEPKADTYAQDRWYPEQVVGITEPATLRDVRFVVLNVSPVQYNPARNEIRVYDDIECIIENTGGIGPNEIQVSPRSISPGFKKLYETFENFRGSALDELPVLPGSYLVLSTNGATILTEVNKLVDWYTRKGLKAKSLTVTSNTSYSNIKNVITNEYNASNGQLEFVCLIGDPSETTGGYAIQTHVSQYDNYYGTLESGGGDNPDPVSDLAVGRISVGNDPDLAAIVAKTISYKKTPYTTDPDWFTTARCAAHTGHAPSNVSTKEYTRQIMLQNGMSVNAVQEFGGGISANEINTIISANISCFNHRLSWNTEMDASTLGSLTSNRALPFVMSISCETGNFDYSGEVGISEEWLHPVGQTILAPKGAIGCVGLLGTGTHVPYNNILDAGAMYGLYALGIEEQGIITIAGKLELYKNYQTSQPGYVQSFCYWANLMGDPAVQVWQKVPLNATVNMPETIALNTNNVSIELLGPGSVPIEGALVSLVKNYTGSETFSRGYSDASGEVNLTVSTPTTGYMQVTITKNDLITVIDSIQVVNAATTLALNSVTIDDDNVGGTSGDNNDILNPGETIDLNISIKNSGISSTATGISGILSTSSAGITIVQASSTYPNIAVGASANPTTPFRILVSSVFNGEPVSLFLELTSSAGTQTVRVNLTPSTGEVTYVICAFYGPGNDLNPGESGPFQVTFRNTGGVTLENATGTLRSLDDRVTVSDEYGTFGTVAGSSNGTNSTNRFAIDISSGMFNGHKAEMELVIEDENGFRDSTQFFITIGLISATSPSGPDAYGYYAFDNLETSPPSAPTSYEWIEICPGQGGFTGTSLNFNDTAEDADQSAVVALPFDFGFYGNNFTQITICSNGWIAFGSYPTIDDFRNYRMGTPVGPPNQAAAFWDDLEVFGASNNVYYYNDAIDHRFIIEWRARTLWTNVNEFFEIILYDSDYYPSMTGDGKLKYQYQSFTSTPNSTSNDNDYFSVGIQNEDHSIGLDYSYWNTYCPGASTLASGRAIMFTTDATGQLTPDIDLSDPNGGATVYVGRTQNIVWQSTAVTGTIDLQINRSYPGATWETIINNTDNDGSYSWTVTGPASSTARVRVLGHDYPSVGDTSDANFSIILPTITLSTPNGGEVLLTGVEYLVEWSGDGLGASSVEVNRNYPGGTWELLSSSSFDSYRWIPTTPPTSNARIRVTSNAAPSVSDVSAASFTIGRPPHVTQKPLMDQSVGSAVVIAEILDDAEGFTSKVFYRKTDALNFDSLAFNATGNMDEYAVTIPIVNEGTHEYFMRTVDTQGFVVRVPETGTYQFDVGEICSGWLQHDGTSESYQWVEGPNYQWAVYFDPGAYPYTICGGRYAICPTNPTPMHGPVRFAIMLADGESNTPGSIIYEDTTGSVNTVGGLPAGAAWTDVVVGSVIATGPFYVSVANADYTDCAVAFALDTDTPSGDSYIFDPCDDLWMSESTEHLNTRDGNRMIRVAGFSFQPPEIVIKRDGINSVQLSWSSTGAPYYKVYSAAFADGPFETYEGSTAELFFTDTNILTTSEIRFYQVFSSTEP